MVLTGYERVKRWRQKSKKNGAYKNKKMREKRRMYRKLFLEGKISYDKIPISYRYFKGLSKQLKTAKQSHS